MNGYHHLTLPQRYLIQELLKMRKSHTFIALEVGCHRSTIWREVKRNTRQGRNYVAKAAQEQTVLRRPERDGSKRKIKGILEEIIIEKLREDRWSPEQISNRLKVERQERISHEAIYRYVYEDRICGGVLYQYLRYHGRRRKRALIRKSRFWEKIVDRKFIDKRPIEATNRKKFGHWERDLVIGQIKEGGALLTVVDRKSRYTLVNKVGSKECDEVGNATLELFKLNPELPLKTMTNDNGCEFGEFSKLEKKLKAPIYFTHPYCSWERGTNENTNGLLREFFPKGSSIASVPDEQIAQVTELLNHRPRKVLSYRTPYEVLYSEQQKLFRSDHYYRKKIAQKELGTSP